jgi:hypothetical protein
MDVRLTAEMYEAFKAIPEIPDYIAVKIEAATSDGDMHVLSMSEDERMVIEEMCQWHVLKDPQTGELTPKAVLFDSIVNAIYDADLS